MNNDVRNLDCLLKSYLHISFPQEVCYIDVYPRVVAEINVDRLVLKLKALFRSLTLGSLPMTLARLFLKNCDFSISLL